MRTVSDVMTRGGIRTLAPRDSMQQAAQAMDELNVGSIPVCDGKQLIGIVTDRDIAVRGVAQGRPLQTALQDVMTADVRWCFEDQPLDDVLQRMGDAQIRRMPVVDRDQQLVGMLSLGDVADKAPRGSAGAALGEISEPAAPDRSGNSQASGAAGGGSTSRRSH
jgi:CBS domain-containing protein